MSAETLVKAEVRAERKISAVAAIIMSTDGRILIVQETQDKPQFDKMAGDWTFPAETLEPEEPLEKALRRLVHEEVGEIKYRFYSKEDWIGDYNVGSPENPIWGRVYLLHYRSGSNTAADLGSVDGEVIGHKWVLPRALRTLPTRRGVLEPIGDFLSSMRGVVCWECAPGARW